MKYRVVKIENGKRTACCPYLDKRTAIEVLKNKRGYTKGVYELQSNQGGQK